MGVPQTIAVLVVFVFFLGILVGVIFGLLPLIWTQVSNLAGETPRIIRELQTYLALLPEEYPHLISVEAVNAIYLQISADRKSTRLNSSHVRISYAVFCL